MLDSQLCLKKYRTELVDLSKWQEIVDLLSELYHSSTGAIVQFRQQEFNVVVSSSNQENFLPPDTKWPWEMKSFCRHIMETNQELYIPCPISDDFWRNAPAVCEGPVRSYCGIPIHWPNGDMFGTICVIDTKPTEYPKTLTTLLNQMARLVESDIEKSCQLQEMKELATKDELTGLLNRRGFGLAAAQKLKDAHFNNQTIAILYIDIDNLKLVNDQHGHDAGDYCISALAQAIKLSAHENDVIARLGGDEFVIARVLRNESDVEKIVSQISNSYQSIADSNIELSNTSLSIGYCLQTTHHSHSLDELIALSDKDMYQAKQSKKGCVSRANT
ncbi:sensor domain-containing diguanylate cyclase [Vibrio atypicus]|uniref:sensor domain-containing diguanylate cyclase n=1 Tax=Vibrio atypicus TaxID=558271 RepID=UPI003734EDF4